MSVTAWNWLLAVLGTIASVLGVVFSWMAWLQAGKAKEAAEDAARWTRRRNAAQEVLRLAGDAKEFLAAIQQHRDESAISFANALVHALAIVRSRGISDASDAAAIKTCENEIVRVIIGLRVHGISEDPPGYSDLLVSCHGIHRSVCELAGRLERLAEGGAQ
jgi:hypothetical protein